MQIDLSKTPKINLTKEDGTTIRNLFIGLNWGKNTYSGEEDFDADLSGFVTDNNRTIHFPEDIINYKFSQIHPSGAVEYSGDNRDGDDSQGVSYNGAHFDEAMYIHTDKMPSNKDVITFAVTIYNAHKRFQDFGMLRNLRVDIINIDNPSDSFYYDLSNSDDFEDLTAVVLIELRRGSNGFKLVKVGKGYTGGTKELYKSFGIEITGDNY